MRRPISTAARRLAELGDALFPRFADGGIDAPRAGWRPDPPHAYCPACGAGHKAPADAGVHTCIACADTRSPLTRLVRLGAYQPPADAWVKSLKWRGGWPHADWLGRLLAEAVNADLDAIAPETAVVPIPMPRRRQVRRGYNQAALLARALCRHSPRHRTAGPLLRRSRYRRPQTTPSPTRRAENARRAFIAAPVDLSTAHVLLVDDVRTTGATLHAAARALQQRGCRHITAAVALVADRRTANDPDA